jgi:hypothetical protein
VNALEEMLNLVCDRLLVHCAKLNIPFDQIASSLIKGHKGAQLKGVSYNQVARLLIQRLNLHDEDEREVFMDYFEFLICHLSRSNGARKEIIS